MLNSPPPSSRFRVGRLGFRVYDIRCAVEGFGVAVQGPAVMVEGLRGQGSGLKVSDFGLKVEGFGVRFQVLAGVEPCRWMSELLRSNEKQFRGGLVFKARRLLYHSALGRE